MKTTILIGGGIIIVLFILYLTWPAIQSARVRLYETPAQKLAREAREKMTVVSFKTESAPIPKPV